MQTGSTMADANRFKFEGDSYYLKSPAEMRALFAELPEACDNTLAIAERCDVSFTEGNGTYMPRYPCPRGRPRTPGSSVRSSVGLQRRYPGGISDAVRARADFEISVIIASMGFAGYFLVVADFINWAKDTASGSGRVAAPAPARSPRTRCGSPISTRSCTD